MNKHLAMGLISLAAGMVTFKLLHTLWYDYNPMLMELAHTGFKEKFHAMMYLLTGVVTGWLAGAGCARSLTAAASRLLLGPLPVALVCILIPGYILHYAGAVAVAFGCSALLSNVDWRRGLEM